MTGDKSVFAIRRYQPLATLAPVKREAQGAVMKFERHSFHGNGARSRQRQSGVMLLEALVGLLIFSIGILALVGMQAVATKNFANAQFRSEASFLASEILSQIWIDQRNASSYATTGAVCPSSPSTQLQLWACRVARLPGATAFPPTITIVPVAGTTVMQVTIVVRWQAPDAIGPSNQTLTANVSCHLTKPNASTGECV